MPLATVVLLRDAHANRNLPLPPFRDPCMLVDTFVFSPSPLEMQSGTCLAYGYLFGGPYVWRAFIYFLGSSSLPRYHDIVSSYSHVYIIFMRTRYMDIYTHVLEGSENGDTMRASDTMHASLRHNLCG